MKKVIFKQEYVFEYDSSFTSYATFIEALIQTRDKIKEKYPEIKDTDITVEFENSVDNLPMSLTFSALETDEEYAERLVEEEPDIMQELLKDL